MNRYIISTIIIFSSIITLTCDKDEPEHIIKLVDSMRNAGTYSIVWNQADKNGKQVQQGNYHAIMLANSKEYRTDFKISSSVGHVPLPKQLPKLFVAIQDTEKVVFLPNHFSISVNSPIYAVGDSVLIQFSLASQAQVTLDIEKEK